MAKAKAKAARAAASPRSRKFARSGGLRPRVNVERRCRSAHAIKRIHGDVVRTGGTFGMANTIGGHFPTTVPKLGGWICGKLSSWFSICFCSPVVIWVLGVAAFVVIGEVLRVIKAS